MKCYVSYDPFDRRMFSPTQCEWKDFQLIINTWKYPRWILETIPCCTWDNSFSHALCVYSACCVRPYPLLHICILCWTWGPSRFSFLGSMSFFYNNTMSIRCKMKACHWSVSLNGVKFGFKQGNPSQRNTWGTNRAKPFQGVTEVTSGGVRNFGADAAKNGISRRFWRWCGRQERRIWKFPSAGSSAPGTQQGAYVQPSRGDTHRKPYESTPQPSPIEINMDIESKKAKQTYSTSNQVDARKLR